MNRLDNAFEIFVESLNELHIPSITVDGPYHKDTEDLYELAFDFYHMLKEARQNAWEDEAIDICENWIRSFELAQEIEKIILDEIKENKNIGIDDELRWLAARALAVKWKMMRYKRLEDKEKQEPEDEEDEAPKKKPSFGEYINKK